MMMKRLKYLTKSELVLLKSIQNSIVFGTDINSIRSLELWLFKYIEN